MKNALVTFGTVSAISLGSAAQAVDYVQCREILRSRNEMVRNAANAEASYKFNIQTDIEHYKCPDIQFEYIGKYGITNKNYDAQRECEKGLKAEIEAAYGQPIGVDHEGAKIYTPEGLSWARSYGKVDAVMKAARCPY